MNCYTRSLRNLTPDEIMAYARELDRLEIHVFDGAHLLLETHYRECADAIRRFVADVAQLPVRESR